MKQNKQVITKIVGVLTDPQPRFVSLVANGANQTPFAVLKTAEPTNGDPAMKSTADTINALKAAARVQAFHFTGAQFADEAAVQAFLSERGYEDFTVIKSTEGFEVESMPAGEFTKTSTIDMAPGVKVVVGVPGEESTKTAEAGDANANSEGETSSDLEGAEVPAAAAASAPSESPTPEELVASELEGASTTEEGEVDPAIAAAAAEAAGTPEVATKFDEYMAYYSNATDLEEVLAQGADGLPPGFYEVTTAMITATKNALMVGDTEAVKDTMGKYADMVIKMAKALSSATVPKSVAQRMILSPEELPAQPAEGSAEVEALKSVLTPLLEQTIQAATKGLVEGQDALKTELAGMATAAGEVTKAVDEISTRLEKVETTAAPRKSVDPEGTTTGEETPKRRTIGKLERNLMGFGGSNQVQ